MRNIALVSLVLIALIVVQCNSATGKRAGKSSLPPSDTGTAQIIFKEYEHDFGKVKEGEKIGFIFTFTNKGTGTLVISNATASCGCTVPKYDTKPISPGNGGNIEVVFDTSGRSGIQTKTISVVTNASTPVTLLKITAEVISNTNN